jgi:hypothetical protein
VSVPDNCTIVVLNAAFGATVHGVKYDYVARPGLCIDCDTDDAQALMKHVDAEGKPRPLARTPSAFEIAQMTGYTARIPKRQRAQQ